MISQCKGRDLGKIPKSKLLKKSWYGSIKYDGNYVQIHKHGNVVKFFTSGGKQFYIEHVAEELIKLNKGLDFIIETEYIANTNGNLGSRTKCSTGSFRSKFSKGLHSGTKPGDCYFKIFDVLECTKAITIFDYVEFKDRLDILGNINGGTYCEQVTYSHSDLWYMTNLSRDLCSQGYEGLFCIHESHVPIPGKKVNTAIKIKDIPTADLLCIDVEKGEAGGKYENVIGSLVLQDSKGRIVSVGSGLDEVQRNPELATWYIGKIIEIKYEQIMETYVQPIFKCVREDKGVKDIT